MYRRYSIYFTPDGALGAAGAAWLGWDIAAGREVAHPDVEGLDIAALVKRPRKYGLHATLKPPMVLAEDKTPEALIQAARDVARGIAPVTVAGLRVSVMGRFLALTPEGEETRINALAARLVAALDRFRAPPSEEELTRRRQRHLTPSQQRHLTDWGYPNVMDDFRFHITLTGPIADVSRIAPKVAAHFAPVLSDPLEITHITIAGEDAAGMFHSIARIRLGA